MRPGRKPAARSVVVSSCAAGFLLVLAAAECGGKREVDAGVEAGTDSGVGESLDVSGYCTWTAYDGTEVHCLYNATTPCKGPPGPNWCDRCYCMDPVANQLGCTSEICVGEPP